jgi:hypothetical protein
VAKEIQVRVWYKEKRTWNCNSRAGNLQFPRQTFSIIQVASEDTFFKRIVDIYIEPIEGITKMFGPVAKE